MARTKTTNPFLNAVNNASKASAQSFASSAKNIFDHMKDFLEDAPSNPISQLKVVIAKNLSYEDQDSEDCFTLLCPLASCDTYAYIKAYKDSRTGDVNHVLNISELRDIVWNEELGFYTFSPPHMNSEATKFSKGVRFCAKFGEYYNPTKNQALFKSVKNSTTLIPEVKFHDSDKIEYHASGGFVEIVHLRQSYEGENYGFSLIKSSRKAALNGTRDIPKVFMLLNEEWAYFGRFMVWACMAYSVIEGESSLEQKRLRNSQKSLLVALGKRKMKIEEEKAKKAKKTPTPAKPKRKTASKVVATPTSAQGVSAAMSLAALKSLNLQKNNEPLTSSGDESDLENGQDPYQVDENEEITID